MSAAPPRVLLDANVLVPTVLREMPAQVARDIHQASGRRGLKRVLEQHHVLVGCECIEGMHRGQCRIPGDHGSHFGLGAGDARIGLAPRPLHLPARQRRRVTAFPPGDP
jgi:hypothetical protein